MVVECDWDWMSMMFDIVLVCVDVLFGYEVVYGFFVFVVVCGYVEFELEFIERVYVFGEGCVNFVIGNRFVYVDDYDEL